jgi:hypothetical protein
MRFKLLCSASILAFAGITLWAQVQPPPQVLPVPIPGGDVVPPFVNQFFPGVGATFDGPNADPHGITNFSGVIAMGYTNGLATDNAGKTYQVITDIRVYRGHYIGAQATFGGGGTTSAQAHGTFVEI